jgi:hypothetical protein
MVAGEGFVGFWGNSGQFILAVGNPRAIRELGDQPVDQNKYSENNIVKSIYYGGLSVRQENP